MEELNQTDNNTKVLEKIDNKLSSYLSLKDEFINDDYVEAFGDGLSVVRALLSSYKFVSKKKLAYFLRGLNYNQEPTFKQLCILYDYIDSEYKAEFISESINKVVKSNSKKASYLLGLLIHRIINSKVNITYKELICANALSEFFDYDLDNIIILSKYMEEIKTKRKRSGQKNNWYNLGGNFKKWCSNNNTEFDNSLVLTIEKCVTSQIFIRDFDIEYYFDDDDISNSSVENIESYKFSDAGELLISNLQYLDIL